jgi:5-methylcytosine-specific restriction endonuclease McrA
MNIVTEKRCNKCGETKPLSEFHRKGKNGYRYQCKACNKIYAQGYFHKHVADFIERAKKWVTKNPGEQEKISHKSYVLHKDEIRARARKNYKDFPEKETWAKKNPEKHKELIRKWDATHRDAKNLHGQTRRAKVSAAGGVITPSEWNNLKIQYDHTCLCCGKREPEIKLTLDHVYPISLGGRNVIENAQPLCKPCNSRKNIKCIDYR